MEPIRALSQIHLFDGLSDVQLELIESICQQRRCRSGEMIFDENSASDEMYIVMAGGVEIQLDLSPAEPPSSKAPAGLVTIASIRPGQVFGEIALVDQARRSAAALSSTDDTILLIIPREKLLLLCSSFPELGYHLMFNLAAELAMKIRSTDIALKEQLGRGAQPPTRGHHER